MKALTPIFCILVFLSHFYSLESKSSHNLSILLEDDISKVLEADIRYLAQNYNSPKYGGEKFIYFQNIFKDYGLESNAVSEITSHLENPSKKLSYYSMDFILRTILSNIFATRGYNEIANIELKSEIKSMVILGNHLVRKGFSDEEIAHLFVKAIQVSASITEKFLGSIKPKATPRLRRHYITRFEKWADEDYLKENAPIDGKINKLRKYFFKNPKLFFKNLLKWSAVYQPMYIVFWDGWSPNFGSQITFLLHFIGFYIMGQTTSAPHLRTNLSNFKETAKICENYLLGNDEFNLDFEIKEDGDEP